MKQTFLGWLVVTCLWAVAMPAFAVEESAFKRVIKSGQIDCGYVSWPPNFIKDPNTGALSGINYEIMEAVGKNLGLKINWKMEAGDIATNLETDKYDVICITMWPSPARVRTMTLGVRPEYYSAIYAVVRADDKRFDTGLNAANAKGVKATGIEGDFSADIVKEKLPLATSVLLPASASPADMMLQLMTKKADILFMDKGGVNEFSKTNPDKVRVLNTGGPVRVYGEHLGVKMGEYQLRDMLDMAMLQLLNDGTLDAIVEKYKKRYNTDIYPSRRDVVK